MSRSGYYDDGDYDWGWIMYRGRVASAIRGKRGQRLLVDLFNALESLPKKRLIAGDLERDGEVCALGAVGRMRGVDMTGLDPEEDAASIARAFDIADCLAREIMFENDECCASAPEERWARMRRWAISHLLPVEEPHPRTLAEDTAGREETE